MSTPAKLVRLTVVRNATQKNVTGAKNWVAIKSASSDVLVEATTAPKNNADEWKQIKWSGDVGTQAALNQRKITLRESKKLHVEASLGGVSDSVDIWVIWATIEIKTGGSRPQGSAPFDPGTRDESDKLGAVSYKSTTSSVIDENQGIFVDNMGASGKVAPVAKLSPAGLSKVVSAGWEFRREVWSSNWVDGYREEKTSNKTWKDDTSKPVYLKLTPDNDDKIYDLDAPDIRWGSRSYETYNNFRQWIQWNGERCSDLALWYWQARWRVHKDLSKQITLNDLAAAKNIPLPAKPFYPSVKSP